MIRRRFFFARPGPAPRSDISAAYPARSETEPPALRRRTIRPGRCRARRGEHARSIAAPDTNAAQRGRPQRLAKSPSTRRNDPPGSAANNKNSKSEPAARHSQLSLRPIGSRRKNDRHSADSRPATDERSVSAAYRRTEPRHPGSNRQRQPANKQPACRARPGNAIAGRCRSSGCRPWRRTSTPRRSSTAAGSR